MPRATHPLLLLLSLLLTACAGSGRREIPESRPLGGEYPVYRAEPSQPEVRPDAPAPRGEVVLRDALAAALLGSPDLASASWETRAAEARTLQASLFPNPELEFEMENFGGTGELSGFSAMEYTVMLSQEIPLAGKLGKRTDVADIEGRLVGWEYEAARLDVLTETTKAFIALLAAQEQSDLAAEAVRLSEEVTRAVREQVAAGKASPVEEKQARVSLALEMLRRDRLDREAGIARRELAAFWGAAQPTFDTVTGDLHRILPVPTVAQLEAHLSRNPDLARWEDAIELSRSKLDSERAEAWPDLTLSGGVKNIRELGIHAFLAGFSISLPLFDRNQGGVGAAAAEARQAEESRRAAEVRIRTEFRTAWQALELAAREAETLTKSVLPTATEAYEATAEGFRGGKFSYLEVLVSQRTLFEAREQLIDSLATYHQAVADVERLIGQSLSKIGSGE